MSDYKAILTAFRRSAEQEEIVSRRKSVLEVTTRRFEEMAEILHISGYVRRDDAELGTALVLRIAASLSDGIYALSADSNAYAAAALLRQFVEVEYLLCLGYVDVGNIARWYTSDDKQRRVSFSPQAMRKRSHGIFRDQEYWMHCNVGGHPHPRARMLLPAYSPTVSPIASLLPDAVQHIRRAWTSTRLLLPNLASGQGALEKCGAEIAECIAKWEEVEVPIVLSFDGISA